MKSRVTLRLRQRLTGFRDLLAFMTGIPLGGGRIEAAASAFPLVPVVGVLEGILASLALLALGSLGVGGALAGAVYLAVHLLVTGAIHLDGFSDYVDVVGSRLSGERAVRVLKDPRKGSHAIVWVVVILIASAASAGGMASMVGGSIRESGLLVLQLVTAIYAASSEAMYIVLAVGRREPYEGLGSLFKDYMDAAGHALNVASYALIASVLALATPGSTTFKGLLLVVLAAPLPLSIIVSRDAEARLGFVNGDVAGFTYEAARTLLLVSAFLALHVTGVGDLGCMQSARR